MKNQAFLLVTLCMVISHAAMADTPKARGALGASASVGASDRIQDGAGAQHLIAGVFQVYDSSRKTVKISDVEYDLDQSLASHGSKLRELRYGQKIVFTQSGASAAKRNVVTTIEPQ